METEIPLVKGLIKETRNDPRIRRALARVIENLDDPNGVISAFDSFASGPRETRPELG